MLVRRVNYRIIRLRTGTKKDTIALALHPVHASDRTSYRELSGLAREILARHHTGKHDGKKGKSRPAPL
ncbi:hypothetical protein KL86DPRO_10507 [uncultured delta proteobacterium]|uniref:Uncharacterized protein n=1 Tax=uncultured delta proteobacterium TaxID=34034 RepID=A0A212J1E4_9DELT|nr:hypothetical protein KL86DPRO_10507 [uncultured delta proteobacterium]